MAVITNIDADHMEAYDHDFERLKRAFVDFAQRLPFYGVAVVCIDDPHLREILPAITKPRVTYGLAEDAAIRGIDVANESGQMRFVARAATAPDLPVKLNLAGVHNVQNALAAIAIGRECGVPDAAIAKALAEFRGVGRRFQRYGDVAADGGGGVHADRRLRPPSDRDGSDDRGRPRQLSRTPARPRVPAASLHAHARPLRGLRAGAVDRRCAGSDGRLSRGEPPIVAADGRALARAVRVAGKVEPVFVEGPAELPDALRSLVRDGDVVVTMGAGSVGQVPAMLQAGP
jgi:UDP-N-acetylmuramate--alanine ligase